jgi:hypothetical protein
MSILNDNVPEKIKILLWGKAAGRCEYEGCNELLGRDPLTKAEFNMAYIAHIVASKPNGPRGDKILSKKLKRDIINLMLLCDRHHRLIDKEDITGHPKEKLITMKRKHEERIELITNIKEEKQTNVLIYCANIGKNKVLITQNETEQAILPDFYPAEKYPIELGLINSMYQDDINDYWKIERDNLRSNFYKKVELSINKNIVNHFSLFAIAPQPLLIELGRLVSELKKTIVYQKHREPDTWKWLINPKTIDYKIEEPSKIRKVVAVNMSLSATINNSRITEVLGDDISIWIMTIDSPNNDFLKTSEQLSIFRTEFRNLLDNIKAKHGQTTELHLFTAVPVAIAIEIGRVWMPKADMTMKLYDHNSKAGGFIYAFDIKHE